MIKLAKRYYWLKLKEDFFASKEIKKLRKIAGGDTYTIIYLKLMLVSLKNEGKLFYEGIEETFAEEVALEIDEDPENVKVTITFLLNVGLMEYSGEEANLTMIPEMVGSETDKAALMRKSRARQKNHALNGNNVTAELPDVTFCYTEKEKDIDKDIEKEIKKKPVRHKYGEYKNVLLTDEELQKLKTEYSDYADRIENLSNYLASTGKIYKSHYATIRNWARRDQKAKPKNRVAEQLDESYAMMAEWAESEG